MPDFKAFNSLATVQSLMRTVKYFLADNASMEYYKATKTNAQECSQTPLCLVSLFELESAYS